MLDIDTVAVAVPDAAGRLIGKRLTEGVWEQVLRAGELPMPDFHLITDLVNVPVPGMRAAGVETGFRNGALRPDLASLRPLPWDGGTNLVLCDTYTPDGAPAESAPRWILRRQTERLAERGITMGAASELEFYLLRTTYVEAAEDGYRTLRPLHHHHGDHDLRVDSLAEPLLGDVRRLMPAAGIPIEVSQGEGGAGQFEVALRWTDPMAMADRHVVYKHGVKVLAERHGVAATFVAKLTDDQPGSSCHVHLSLTDAGGTSLIGGEDGGLSAFGAAFVAGLLAAAPDLCLMFAPYPNSYRRLQPGSWAPTTRTWGFDNRTCLVRVCGEPAARRLEFRLPGADVNPYLAFAGVIAAGLHGVDAGLVPPPPTVGDAYAADAPGLPRDLGEALAAFRPSAVARDAFGPEVQEHLAGLAAHELETFRRQVTDRELARAFEVA